MATRRYTANAQYVAAKVGNTVASPASGSSIYAYLINGKTFNYTAQSSTDTAVATALADALNADSLIRELDACTFSASGAIVYATASTPGNDFTFTSRTVSGGGTFTGTSSTINSGPGVVSLAANWSGSLSAADTLIIDKAGVNINMDLSGLAGTAFTAVYIPAVFDGELGLPYQNTLGYPEYLECYFHCNAPIAVVGYGDGNGATRCYLNLISASSTTLEVFKTGRSNDTYPACCVKGTATVATARIVDGSVGLAILGGETLTVTTLTVGSQNTSPTVSGGKGLTLGTLVMLSGTATLAITPSTLLRLNASSTVIITDSGNSTAVVVDDGSTLKVIGNGTAITFTDLTLGQGAVLDLSIGTGTLTVTNAIVYDSTATIYDPAGRLASNTNWTNATGNAPPNVVTNTGRQWRLL